MKGDLIYGKHRSHALAERHARELAREFDAPFEIIARRRADGRYSARGHYFTFEKQEPPKKEVEYVLHFDGGSGSDKDKNRTPIVDVQVHLSGFEAEDAEVRRIYKTWWEENTLPEGWTVKAIAWQRAGKSESGNPEEVREWLGFALRKRPRSVDRT